MTPPPGFSIRLDRWGRFLWLDHWARRSSKATPYGLRWLGAGTLLAGHILAINIGMAFMIGLMLTGELLPAATMLTMEGWIPAMVVGSTLKEIGPLIAPLLCVGMVGSQGDLPLRQAKEPLLTRMSASTLAMLVLVILGDLAAILGAYLGLVLGSPMDLWIFLAQGFEDFTHLDYIFFAVKILSFGGFIGFLCRPRRDDTGPDSADSPRGVAVPGTLGVLLIDLLLVGVKGLVQRS